ncbi:tryptophan synthase subunit alpha [Agaribacter marinus]|uniref:Tryptophan synthase alpha chain n=1 Tax=Virgibacillus salarius TaxID=447199 RepID=A0A941DWT8_9BACI|nr:tryptophan synthase subunit alpha [Virgibacillus salarius]MBR7796916.1 tryptophan synthase subunit alpha [Virgibacillus salarius]NAZ09626.1 tryptophan synthase subunit alpha [Agaribacter marinus]WBX80798.1 tryptophan synthase subunit alpha [Virgibacillus salarius]
MGKERLVNYLNQLQNENKNLFVPYIMAGDGGLNKLKERTLFLQNCGVAAIEVGIPFSDPVADGPTIQNAGKRSLDNDTTLTAVLEELESFKDERTVPIIIMAYSNPIYRYGIERFAASCVHAGIDGLIIPDLTLEEEKMVTDALQQSSVAFIRLAALTSSRERIKTLAHRSEGFLYAVTVTGTTGVRTSYETKVKTYLHQLKQQSPVPVLAGFGVSTSKQAKELSSYCDGVVVGSKIVDLFHEGKTEEIKQLIQASI